MSHTTRRVLTWALIACTAGAIVGLALQEQVLMMLPRLLAYAACTIAVILWVRPHADSDMLRKAEITGYLAGMAHRADVIHLDERRPHDDVVQRRLSSASPRRVPDGG